MGISKVVVEETCNAESSDVEVRMFSRAKDVLLKIGVGLFVTLAVALASAVIASSFLAKLSGWLLSAPLDPGSLVNWVSWAIEIGLGALCLVAGPYLAARKWKAYRRERISLHMLISLVMPTSVLTGLGVGALWFSLGQVGLALIVRRLINIVGS